MVQDKYFRMSKEQGYLARSAFKLIEINDKFRIFTRSQTVLDLGSFPGSWLQVILKQHQVKDLIGIDLQEIKLKDPKLSNYQADITDPYKLATILNSKKFDLITADLAPKTSGIRDADQYHAVELNLSVLRIAKLYLKPQGKLVTKVFVGADFARLIKAAKQQFKHVKNFKPKACRDRSFETYLICWN